ncbi:MAG TPA: hypothetical protein VGB22_00010 [candidate division Zixibacteria bacterium]|jgi:Tol biopolymer transport system component
MREIMPQQMSGDPDARRHAFGTATISEVAGRRGAWMRTLFLVILLMASCSSKSNDPQPVVIKQIWYTPAWSPDGREIACAITRIDHSNERGSFVSILDAATGEVRREHPLDFPPPFAFSWTPDGAWLLFGASPGIFKLSSHLDSLVQLTSGEAHTHPSFSKARNIVFFSVNDARLGGLYSVTLSGDSLRRWSTQDTHVLWTSAFPDESDSLIGYDAMRSPYRLIVFSPEAIGSALFLGGESHGGGTAHISPDHRFVAYNRNVIIDEIGNLVLLDRSTDSSWGITPLLTSEMSFSPDGRKLVYPILAGKEVGLWILDVQTGEQTRLTDGTQ